MSGEKKKAWGRTLKEFQTVKEDFAIEGLYPAEHGLMKACELGVFYVCEGFNESRPTSHNYKTNFIRFDFLRFLILGGDEKTPVDGKGVQLAGAYIGDGARGLDIEGHKVPYDIALQYCHMNGDLNAIGASIQVLDLKGSSIREINADRMITTGSVFLSDGFVAKSKVRFLEAEIGGGLDCRGGRFLSEDEALFCDRMSSKGSVSLCQTFEAKSTVCLIGAKIGGNLDCVDGKFKSKKNALHLQSVKISDGFLFRNVAEFKGDLNLTAANIDNLVIDAKSWDLPESVNLNGCEYLRFAGKNPDMDGTFWLNSFLAKQKFYKKKPDDFLPSAHNQLAKVLRLSFFAKQKNDEKKPDDFLPSAHNQLAKVLRKMGHEEQALDIHIDRNWRTLKAEKHRLKGWNIPKSASLFWRQMLGWTTGFGYRPLRTLWFLMPLFLAGWFVFFSAAERGIMAPTDPLIYVVDGNVKAQSMIVQNCRYNWTSTACARYLPPEHSTFSPAIYSLDVMLPIINFRQQDDWAPRLKHPYGIWENLGWQVRAWEWFQTIAGWLLSLLLVSGVTGIIRKD